MTPAIRHILLNRARFLPSYAPGFFADYDISDVTTLAVDGSNRVSLWADKSGNSGRDLSQGTVASQPVYLPFSGTNYGWLNSVAGNYFSSPDSANADVTGSIDLRCQVAMDDWTPSESKHLVSKYQTVAGGRAYTLGVNTDGTLLFWFSQDGNSGETKSSTAATGFADGATKWVRATKNTTTGEVLFYASDDGIVWTQLGSSVSGTASSIFSASSQLEVGSYSTGQSRVAGRIFRAQVLNGINGTVVADFNPALYTGGTTFTASTGEVWTLNGGAAIVTRSGLYFDGSNDYLKSAPFSLSEPLTYYFVGGQSSWTSGDWLYDGATSTTSYARQAVGTPQIRNGSGITTGSTVAPPLATAFILSSVFSGASSSTRLNRDASVAGPDNPSSPNGFTLMSRGDGAAGSGVNGFVSEVLIYAAAHDQATQNRIIAALSAKWGIQL